ncbi:MAG: cation diffusion facilitator family transporter [Lachnospiraceae bacterium]|nr:cation diffusion facilitator family transporter [Lachnospiraceae bacterium]
MKLLYKILKQNPNSREGIITTTSWLGILTNLLVASVKIIIGALASSIAIVSEGVNNAADVFSSVITLVGTKLATKHPDEKHPFGYGRIEYLTGLVISVLILVTGIEMLSNSINLIFHPEELNISYFSLAIVFVSAIVKFVLGKYTIKQGKKADSSALEGVGVDSCNDSYASIITIVAALVFLIFHFSIDAFAGVITSLLIVKAGFDILKDTLGEIVGRPGDEELAKKLFNEIIKTEGIIGAADMMLHNYGPDAWSGSINVEIDHKESVGELYQRIHNLQLRIMREYHVVMVFGIYAVDNDNEYVKELRSNIGKFVLDEKDVKSFHAVYIEPDTNKIYCDLVVTYDLRDWDDLRVKFIDYIKALYPEKELELTIETEFV